MADVAAKTSFQPHAAFAAFFLLALSGTAHAADAPASPPSGIEALMNLVPMIAIIAIVYALIIRPQQKRIAEHKKKIDAVRRGDKVITGGGILGEVVHVRDREVEVLIAPDVRVKVLKETLSDVSRVVT